MLQSEKPSYAKLTNELRSSIVRIQKIETVVNWFEPYGESPQSSAVGTGFAAELIKPGWRGPSSAKKDPVFVTNAHVVRNARTVKIQFPAVGQETFDGYVPVIYEDHDLAVVKLVDPGPFLEYIQQKNATLRPLPIRKHEEIMGQTVAAIGFPLGSSTLKLSTGVIAGTESMDGMTVFQCTAPISPGNSGGPLLMLGDLVGGATEELQVVGVNFAATTAQMAENVNYVIPAVHIQQILHKFHSLESKEASEKSSQSPVVLTLEALTGRKAPPQQREKPHTSMRLAPIGALAVHANPALYTFGGCKEGVFISHVSKRSALYNAKPRVEEMSFIMSVDGVSLDGFGMGRMKDRFLGDPLPFQSLMQIKESSEDPVELITCKNKTITKHTVSMVWKPDYEPGIRMITEPHFEPDVADYEIFADVTVMQMTQNHVASLIASGGVPPSYGRWLLEDNEVTPRLIITKVQDGTYASTVLAPGMVVSSINGHNVSSLKEFRQHFEPADGLWRLVTERGSMLVVAFAEAFAEQLLGYKQGRAFLLTPAVTKAAQRHGLVANADEQQATMKLASLFSKMLSDAYAQGQANAGGGSQRPVALGRHGGKNGTSGGHHHGHHGSSASTEGSSFLDRRSIDASPGAKLNLDSFNLQPLAGVENSKVLEAEGEAKAATPVLRQPLRSQRQSGHTLF